MPGCQLLGSHHVMRQPNPDVGGKQECKEVLKARGENMPKANSVISMDSEHFALDGISQKEKIEKL